MNQDYLSELRDIHVPPPPSLWPLTLGAYVLIFATLVLLIVLFIWYQKFWKRLKLKAIIKKELSLIESKYQQNQDRAYLQNTISRLLKRITLKKPEEKIFPKKELLIVKDLLIKDRFTKDPNIDATKLLNQTKELLKKCRI